ncbi:alpha/beta hydrolase [Gulosibacter bifidus]|uniref:Alpha/beta hydrolase n=1 Tax=Gulosibacter bifidus TaxID=272239 RepID=A0ABW5RGK1_9MICO|nr:dienelactone hydrolase family protein [Gulosibacter bifidus]
MTSISPISTVLGANAGLQGRPLVVLMHGYGANEQDLLGVLVELGIGTTDERFDWISVRAPLTAKGQGYAWFPLEEVMKVGDEQESLDTDAIDASCAALVELLDDIAPDVPVIPIGFSQGAVMAIELLRAVPERVLAAVACSGFVVPSAGDQDAELTQLRRPVFFGWGDRDESPIPQQAFPQSAQWLKEHTNATVKNYPELTHAISPEEIADITAFLNTVELPAAQ